MVSRMRWAGHLDDVEAVNIRFGNDVIVDRGLALRFAIKGDFLDFFAMVSTV